LAVVFASGAALAEPAADAPAPKPASTSAAPVAAPAASPHAPAAKPAAKPAHPATARIAKPQAARYAQYVKTWHTPAPNKLPPVDESGRPKLVLFSLNTNDRIEIAAATDRGGFAASDLDRAAYVLREPSSGNEYPVEPRALDVVYRIQAHFQAQEIRVISGYRTPHGAVSNHGRGRAIDLVVPGVSDQDVAKFARELGFVGVGIYPSGGFVHVDVRDRSYFWVDASGPGRRNRERGILGDLASKSDAQALARGEARVVALTLGFDVDAALRARAPASAAEKEDDDEDDDTDEPSEDSGAETAPAPSRAPGPRAESTGAPALSRAPG
jgi:uncharacterized protein YcbK (DUF882 family)